MSNVTYLFGAGASYETIPIVNEFPLAIKEMIVEFDNITLENNSYNKLKKQFIKELEHLEYQTKQHMSIDTYAKKLFIINKSANGVDEYKEFKKIFACLLLFLNFYNGYIGVEKYNTRRKLKNFNMRYDALFAGLIKNDKKFTDNINILTWNYDFEIEKALYEYYRKETDEYKVNNLQYIYNIHPSSKTENLIKNWETGFKICKLNGNLFYETTEQNNHKIMKENQLVDIAFSQYSNDKLKDLMINILEYYDYLNSNESGNETLINFSWENVKPINDTHKIAKTIIHKTDVLVIVGYSFPYFNREIDRYLFHIDEGRSGVKLNKIYIQDIDRKSIQLKDSLKAVFKNKFDPTIIPLENYGNDSPIYIPPEL